MGIKMSLGNVGNTFAKLRKDVSKRGMDHTGKVVQTMVADLKQETPIDTGFARNRWASHPTAIGFNVTNDAEYIEHLNHGSSKQAPAFFVEKTALKYGVPNGAIVETI